MANMWMVRSSDEEFLYDEFKNFNIIALKWDIGDLSNKNREEIKGLIKKKYSRYTNLGLGNISTQISNFVHEFKKQDYVISYNYNSRKYLIGKINSDYYFSDVISKKYNINGFNHIRNVEWLGEVNRDDLKKFAKKSLNTSHTVFKIKNTVKEHILEVYNEFNDEDLKLDDDGDDDLISGIGDDDVKTTRYWLVSAGYQSKLWDEFYRENIVAIGMHGLGDLSNYENKQKLTKKFQSIHHDRASHMHDVHASWQFVHDMQVGDVVFIKSGFNKIIARGIVESDYKYDKTKSYHNIRNVKWTKCGSWTYKRGRLPTKALTDITFNQEDIDYISDLIADGETPDEPQMESYPKYSVDDFLEEAYINDEEYYVLRDLLKNKKNIIVQGAPGVGKTFMAKRLAYSIIGEKDVNKVRMVQFHQSYSYEDFVMGYKPAQKGFELKNGSFYKFCKKAEEDSENSYFFIIDEINRGNLSKIFGELFMLIENDKRGEKNKIKLLYADESFFIPKNVYIIGLMNTADRSLAMIDYALRRRFAFFDLKPGFDSDGFKNYQHELDNNKFDRLIEIIRDLNDDIKNEESLGAGFRIGHSYLCNIKSENVDEKLNYIVDYELIPLLKEYWFDEQDKINYWSDRLRSVLND